MPANFSVLIVEDDDDARHLDAGRSGQVLRNLLENAAFAAADHGHIHVRIGFTDPAHTRI